MTFTRPPHTQGTEPNKRSPPVPPQSPRPMWGGPHTFSELGFRIGNHIRVRGFAIGWLPRPSQQLIGQCFSSWHVIGCNALASRRRLRRRRRALIYVNRGGAGRRGAGPRGRGAPGRRQGGSRGVPVPDLRRSTERGQPSQLWAFQPWKRAPGSQAVCSFRL